MTTAIPRILAGPDVRFAVHRRLELRVAPALEIALWRQRLDVNGRTVADLGVARGLLVVAVSVPVR